MRVLTWNLAANSRSASSRAAAMQWALSQAPDVLLLQEARPPWVPRNWQVVPAVGGPGWQSLVAVAPGLRSCLSA